LDKVSGDALIAPTRNRYVYCAAETHTNRIYFIGSRNGTADSSKREPYGKSVAKFTSVTTGNLAQEARRLLQYYLNIFMGSTTKKQI
jgi:hypothetical protein